MPIEQSVRYILEQGEVVSPYEWDRRGHSCARPACIIGVYRKGLALKSAGHLYEKNSYIEVYVESVQLHKRTGKRLSGVSRAAFPRELCMIGGQFRNGRVSGADGIVRKFKRRYEK